MQSAQLGRTDLSVTRICLGSMTWGSQNSEAEGWAQIDRALERGVNFIDTAELYPTNPIAPEKCGRTEEVIGNWIANNKARRGDVIIATKVASKGSAVRDGAAPDGAMMRLAVENSLKRLKTDVIDLYQLHWPVRGSYHFRQVWKYDPTKQNRDETIAHIVDMLETAAALIKEGKIRSFGLSNETCWGIAQWLRVADEQGLPRVVSTQNEYNLLYRPHDIDLAELSHNEDVGLLSYSPLAGGILSGKYLNGARPEPSRAIPNPTIGGRLVEEQEPATAAYVDIARRHGLDPSAMALAWCLTRPFMTSVIIGATTLEQLDVCLSAADLTLSDEVLAEIQAVYRRYPMAV
ncbi:MAG: aldo/keto reductase [Neomegalonema sp.]|nr:aldo/keto reductase [Neomegalonema sp.]